MNRRSTYLRPLPDSFVTTVAAVHAIAEHVLCVPRYAAIGRVGLVAASSGIETSPFGADDRVVGIEGDELVDVSSAGERRARITTVRDAAAFFGVAAGAPGRLWTPVTSLELDTPLAVDPDAVQVLADWYSFVAEALAGMRDAGATLDPLTLWPEGFDLATTGERVNYGGSPGDRFLAQPYIYVGPFDRSFPHVEPPYWNASFGASLSYDAIGSLDEAVAFLVRGYRLARG